MNYYDSLDERHSLIERDLELKNPKDGKRYFLKSMNAKQYIDFCEDVSYFVDVTIKNGYSSHYSIALKKRYFEARRKLKEFNFTCGYCASSDWEDLKDKMISLWTFDDLISFASKCSSVRSIEFRKDFHRLYNENMHEKLISNLKKMKELDAYDKNTVISIMINYLNGTTPI